MNIINSSIKEAFHWCPTKYFVGTFGGLVATFFFLYNFYLDEYGNHKYTILESVTISIFFLFLLYVLFLLFFIVKNTIKYLHQRWIDSIWNDALKGFAKSYTYINKLRRQQDVDTKEFVDVLQTFCDCLKNTFDKLTTTNCSVSIKIPIIGGENTENLTSCVVSNICRDSKHKNRDTIEYQNTTHTIIGNTPYRVIVCNLMSRNFSKALYINNSVNSTRDYNTTSPSRTNTGKVDYNSEIVIPIRPNNDNDQILVGFICIDSELNNAFKFPEAESTILKVISDGLYDVIVEYLNKQ